MNDLISRFQLAEQALSYLTSSVQVGFIIGTLTFAVLTIADRFSPSKVFFGSAVMGALFNLGIIWEGNVLGSILLTRFCTGFFLAGIYPVGMKIAADYVEKGLGKSLGFLVGALVVGTAFPHLLKELTGAFPWRWVIMTTSGLAVIGGLIMLVLVPDGPFRKESSGFHLSAIFQVFSNRTFTAASLGYVGHMWELYAFWAFIPIMLKTYQELHEEVSFNIPLLSFCIIAIGGVACVIGGYLSQSLGTKRTAFLALLLSGSCCLLCPWLFQVESAPVLLSFLLFWGMVVIADSPLFSTLVAQHAPAELKGTALTIVNCIGFSITIISIQLMDSLQVMTDSQFIYLVLAIGPVLGLIALAKE